MRRLIIIILIIGIISGAIIVFLRSQLVCTKYSCLVFPGKEHWTVQEVYENGDKEWRGLLSDHNTTVRLDRVGGVSTTDASNFTKISLMKIEGLFDNARSPYPGAISDQITCQNKYKPVIKTLTTSHNIQATYLSAYYNNRLQLGSCVDDQVVYQGYVSLFYCANTSEWYQIELMTPVKAVQSEQAFTEVLKGVGCQQPRVLFP